MNQQQQQRRGGGSPNHLDNNNNTGNARSPSLRGSPRSTNNTPSFHQHHQQQRCHDQRLMSNQTKVHSKKHKQKISMSSIHKKHSKNKQKTRKKQTLKIFQYIYIHIHAIQTNTIQC